MSRRSQRGIASTPLPNYRAIFAVDTVRFTANRSLDQPDLSETVQHVIEQAMHDCGLADVWRTRRFPQGTGDGYMFGTSPVHMPFLVYPLFDQLQITLADENRLLAARRRDLRLRLRASLHVGPVPDDGNERRDRIGTPTNDTFRLLDSVPIKNALKRANPDVTYVAAIVSQRVFEDVVRAGYTGIHPDRFSPVTAEVPDKDFAEPAWLYVPCPSASGLSDEPTSTSAQRTDAPTQPHAGAPNTTVHGRVGQAFTAQHVSGHFNPVFGRGFPASPGQAEQERS